MAQLIFRVWRCRAARGGVGDGKPEMPKRPADSAQEAASPSRTEPQVHTRHSHFARSTPMDKSLLQLHPTCISNRTCSLLFPHRSLSRMTAFPKHISAGTAMAHFPPNRPQITTLGPA